MRDTRGVVFSLGEVNSSNTEDMDEINKIMNDPNSILEKPFIILFGFSFTSSVVMVKLIVSMTRNELLMIKNGWLIRLVPSINTYSR